MQPFSPDAFFTGAAVRSPRPRGAYCSRARPLRCHWFPKRIVSHARSLSFSLLYVKCRLSATIKYVRFAATFFNCSPGNNAVDFFTRYISAGAAPGCLGIMSVCIEQKIKTRVCAPCGGGMLPDCGFCSWLSAVQFGGNTAPASSMAFTIASLVLTAQTAYPWWKYSLFVFFLWIPHSIFIVCCWK